MFCTNCGTTIADDVRFCPLCGSDLKKVIEILKEPFDKGDIPSTETDLKLSLEGVEIVNATPNISNEFNIVVYNTSPNSIPGVEVQLSGPTYVDLIKKSNYYDTILSGQMVITPFIIRPKYSGFYTLTATLRSGVGHSITFPIEVRVKTVNYSPVRVTRSKPPLTVNQILPALIVVALIGIILMIWGIISFFRPSGLAFNGAITVLIIGFILLTIGTKGQCCILPFACACDDCDCDC